MPTDHAHPGAPHRTLRRHPRPGSRRSGRSRRATAAATVVLAGVAWLTSSAVVAPAQARAGGSALRIDFDEGDSLAPGTRVTDVSGSRNHGVVVAKWGGTITPRGGSAAFPGPCSSEPCPNAMIRIPDDPSLDPGTASFEWGARLRLAPDETADGENVLQKGRWGDAGGQWKLQVDKAGGHPSCVVSGFRGGTEHRVIVKSSVGIADGSWHDVACRRTSSAVAVYVDSVRRGAASMPAVDLSGAADVTIGAKEVETRDNDQYQGRMDDVYMTLI